LQSSQPSQAFDCNFAIFACADRRSSCAPRIGKHRCTHTRLAALEMRQARWQKALQTNWVGCTRGAPSASAKTVANKLGWLHSSCAKRVGKKRCKQTGWAALELRQARRRKPSQTNWVGCTRVAPRAFARSTYILYDLLDGVCGWLGVAWPGCVGVCLQVCVCVCVCVCLCERTCGVQPSQAFDYNV
jgi:hypothetical protein